MQSRRPTLARLARAYEADSDQRRDLLQDMHLVPWKSFASFEGQCSLRTWVYRVSHSTAISARLRRRKVRLVSLEELSEAAAPDDLESAVGNARAGPVGNPIRRLAPPDDQVMLLYLEDVDAVSIGEITGLSARAVATRGSKPCCRGSSGRRRPMDDLKTVWRTQPLEDDMITLTSARARADKFQSRVRLRNVGSTSTRSSIPLLRSGLSRRVD